MKKTILLCIEKSCGNQKFSLSEKDVERYRANGHEMPKRCPPCRDRRRREAAMRNG